MRVIAMRKILVRAALVGVVIFASNGWLLGAANASGSSILEPAAGALLGHYYGASTVAQTTAKLGRTPPVHLTYYAWTDDWTGTVTQADLAAGRIPLVNWEPHKIDFTKIIDGSLDATIVARANGSKALGKRFFLDFAAEMNGDEAWGGNNAPPLCCRLSTYSRHLPCCGRYQRDLGVVSQRHGHPRR